MRTQRGFDRARYFAKSLGHRRKPLHALRARRGRAQPHADPQDVRDPARLAQRAAGLCRISGIARGRVPGLAEASPRRSRARTAAMARAARARTPSARWPGVWRRGRRHPQRARRPGPRRRAIPLASLRETGALFQQLQSEPFGTVAEIVDDRGPEGRSTPSARRESPSSIQRLHRERQPARASAGASRALKPIAHVADLAARRLARPRRRSWRRPPRSPGRSASSRAAAG